MKIAYTSLLVALVLSSCVMGRSTTTKSVDKNGIPSNKTTSWIVALGDTRTTVGKYSTTVNTNYQGTSVSSLDNSTTTTNLPTLIEAVTAGAIQGALKASTK